MDPDRSVVFAYEGVLAHLDLAIPAPYVHPVDIVEKVLSCLKVTPMAKISILEFQRCACTTGMRAKPQQSH